MAQEGIPQRVGVERYHAYLHFTLPEGAGRLAESRWDMDYGVVKFFDKDGERREASQAIGMTLIFIFWGEFIKLLCFGIKEKEANKSVWGMPRHSETTKDVVSCDKLRGVANELWSADVRMGQPLWLKTIDPVRGDNPENWNI